MRYQGYQGNSKLHFDLTEKLKARRRKMSSDIFMKSN